METVSDLNSAEQQIPAEQPRLEYIKTQRSQSRNGVLKYPAADGGFLLCSLFPVWQGAGRREGEGERGAQTLSLSWELLLSFL